jgi:hypothetical protein
MGALRVVLPILLGVMTLIAGGLLWFASSSMEEIESNLQAIIKDLQKIASYASWHYARPSDLGGGDGSFLNSNGGEIFKIPKHLRETDNAAYELVSVRDEVIVVRAVSTVNSVNNVTVKINTKGEFVGKGLAEHRNGE